LEVPPRRVRDILDAHNRLVTAYQGVLREVANQPFNVKLPVEIPNPFLLKRLFQGRYERMAYLSYAFFFTIRWPLEVLRYSIISFLSLFRSSYHFEPRVLWRGRLFCWRPFLRYMILLHIRRNYNKLYGLYIQEILVQSVQGESKELLNDFRQAADDLKKYTDNMPGSRKFFLSLGALLSLIAFAFPTVGWILEVFGVDVRGLVSGILTAGVLLGIATISVMVSLPALAFFAEAFTLKRVFFVRPKNRAYYVANNVFLQDGSWILTICIKSLFPEIGRASCRERV